MKRKNTDSTNYKYDMYDERPAKRRKPRQRTWSEFGKQVAGGAAASTLGYIHGNLPTAIEAGTAAYEYLAPDLEMDVDDEEDRMTPLLEAAGITPKNINGMSSGKYYNKSFRRPSKGGKYSPLTKYQANGVVYNKEIYGKITSPDCVYIGHSTYDLEGIAMTITLAILRKIFKKGGMTMTSTKERPFGGTLTDGFGFKIQIVTCNINDGSFVHYDIKTSAVDSFEDIALKPFLGQGFCFFDLINLLMQQNDSSTIQILETVVLYTIDKYGTGGDNEEWRLAASLNMKNEVMKVYLHSTLHVQNVTKGSSSASNDDTAVDAQPLKGVFYHFSGGTPTSKQHDNFKTSRILSNGTILLKASQLSPAEDFKEPPIPAYFNNCYKASKIGLEPGSIKKANVYSYFSGYFNNVLFGRLTTKRGQNFLFNTPGKSQLIALEEVLNTGSDNLITCSYQREINMGVMFITGKASVAVAKHTEISQDNI